MIKKVAARKNVNKTKETLTKIEEKTAENLKKEDLIVTDESLQNFADDLKNALNDQQEKEILDSFPMPTLVDPSVTLIHEQNVFKKIEMAGRTCYKSEDAITKESAKKFVEGLRKRQHMAMLEHASLVFLIDCKEEGHEDELMDYIQFIQKLPFMQVTLEPSIPRILVSGNIRAILERKIIDPVYRVFAEHYPEFAYPDDLEGAMDATYYNLTASIVDLRKMKDLTEDEFKNHFYFTCKFVTDRGVTHEMVRHRLFSFAQESTRYCNYNKDKFGGHCTFCKPSTYDSWTEDQKDVFTTALSSLDSVYTYLTSGEHGLSPQQARAVLPNCLKTEIVVTGPASEWRHFYNLRSKGTTGAPHPDIKVVADMALHKMNKYLRSLKFDRRFRF